MRDEERIDMYYKFGLLDWKSEQAECEKERVNKKQTLFYRLVLLIGKKFNLYRLMKNRV